MITIEPGPHAQMKCHICGGTLEFAGNCNFTRREFTCPLCGSTQRQSDLAKILLSTFVPGVSEPLMKVVSRLSHLSIFEAQSFGPIHDILSVLPGYTCSEYFDDTPCGTKNPMGINCEDLERLTFSSDSFDLVITQDVFEHIRQPEIAFAEIFRVLKPGGFHIFTIPFHEGKMTLRRIIIHENIENQNYPPVFHSDPLRKRGSLVYTDFGLDMDHIMGEPRFVLEKIPCGIWYDPNDIPYINCEKEYDVYSKTIKEKNLLEFFLYNSWVFRARKISDNYE